MRSLIPFVYLTHLVQLLSVCLLICTLLRRPNPVKYFTPLFLFIVFYFFTDLTSTIFVKIHINNAWMSSIYYPIEYFLLSWLFFSMGPKHHKRLIYIFGVAAGIGFLLTSIFFKGASGHNFLGMSFIHAELLIIAGRFLVWLVAKGQSELGHDPQFYITLGIILDCGMTAISYILFDTFEFHLPYIINTVSDSAAFVFFLIGIFLLYKNEMTILKALQNSEEYSAIIR